MSTTPITIQTPAAPAACARRYAVLTTEPWWVRGLLIGTTLVFLGVFLFLPLVAVFAQALSKGFAAYLHALVDPDALAAIRLTLLTAAVAVPASAVVGLAAAWAIGKFRFVGRSVLITVIDLPFTVSPVIAGLIFVLLFGRNGWLGPWLDAHGIRVIFAMPGIILVTLFITFPFVARELIPLMQAQGTEEEEAARVLGASGWQMFRRVTFPNIKWALLYGVILCNARAMGEFGAVSVVSGHIRGCTNTMPLHVEILYNDYEFAAAFAVASLLAILALVTLVAKSLVEWQAKRQWALAEQELRGTAGSELESGVRKQESAVRSRKAIAAEGGSRSPRHSPPGQNPSRQDPLP